MFHGLPKIIMEGEGIMEGEDETNAELHLSQAIFHVRLS